MKVIRGIKEMKMKENKKLKKNVPPFVRE